MIKPGIYPDLDNQDYHYNPECQALSKGGIDRLLTSPAHFKIQGQNPSTKEMIFGSAFHTMVLEPDVFDSEVSVAKTAPPKARNEAENAGVCLITEIEMEHINRMTEAVHQNKTASSLLGHADAAFENSIFWHDSAFDILCKCRPDITIKSMGILTDLKSTKSASPVEFAKSCANYNYDTQSAHYLEGAIIAHGTPFKHFLFIAVEKTPPYAVAVYRADDEMVANGAIKVADAKAIYQKSVKTNNWQAFPDKVIDITLPRWAYVN